MIRQDDQEVEEIHTPNDSGRQHRHHLMHDGGGIQRQNQPGHIPLVIERWTLSARFHLVECGVLGILVDVQDSLGADSHRWIPDLL